ncbi:RHS repeat-associated core domain-containing protein [Myxococcus llanfairpwllgwyngyllgogerychwyrndrobwllllantysiliogogogochensis]|uniref:RHS repeat-associated core domain-containing protein n=1 Tax=Myxococcus llanfairpwllgwyngyllgogerychwyrndrobwllllantysiliogogogochensis TaxID=2590453 RepID=UPI0015F01C27|nr:RHS repeat-associated core domain-containing protein [Myxococcus llanfairpwllgwyngyllgogerychwyrndrobwllllantysiliogogogochensis]
MLGGRTTRHDATDVVIPGVLGNIEFKRSYVSTEKKWALDQTLGSPSAGSIPKPFGNSPTYSASLNWWHNFYSFVYPRTALPNSELWQVREGSGKLVDFTGCLRSPSSCLAHPTRLSGETQWRLIWESTGPNSGYFVLHKPGTGRFIYADVWTPQGGTASEARYFLSRIEDAQQLTPSGQPLVLATLTYTAPSGLSCPGLSAGANPGVPYLATIESLEGTRLRFEYKRVANYLPGQPEQCVLARVLAESSASTAPATSLVEYNYLRNDAGVEIAGLIESAPLPQQGGAVESYTYPNLETGTGQWQLRKGGAVFVTHTSTKGKVTSDSSIKRGKRGSGSLSLRAQQPPAPCTNDSSPACKKTKTTTADLYAFDGRGTSFYYLSQYAHVYDMEQTSFARPWRIRRVTRPCPEAASCTQTREFVWHQFDDGPAVSLAEKDFENGWTVREWEGPPDGGVGGYADLKRIQVGADNRDGGSALETVSFEYTNATAGTGLVVGERIRTEERTDSVLVPAEEAVTRYVHDPATNRLQAVFRSGYTQGLTGSAWDTTPVLKHLGTFYFTRHACAGGSMDDALGRVLEVHGPCWVDNLSATDCSPSLNPQVPITQYHYWPAGAAGHNAYRLQKVVRFPNTGGSASCTGQPGLETLYSNYDLWGQPQLVVDANGVSTTYTYETGRVTSITTQGATWNYTYDNGTLAYVKSPRGDYEMFCRRQNQGSSSTCTGPWYDDLRARSKLPFPGGHANESIRYDRGSDGLISSETYSSSYWGGGGMERRARYHQANLDGMPSYERVGGSIDAQGSHYVQRRLFDGAERLVGLGAPYNVTPALCNGQALDGRPVSPLCSALSYDRANRLTGVEQFPEIGTRANGTRACFAYDIQGNVKTVRSGCSAASGAIGDCSSCTQPLSTYQHDDFGNLIQVALPWQSGNGRTRYSHDATGQVRAKQTPQMESGSEHLAYAYDALGRPLSTARIVGGTTPTTELLYTLGYDQSATPHATCPQPANTQGRLLFRNDSFGQTWYSYDGQGRVVREIRARAGTDGSFSCPAYSPASTLHTTYSYSSAGDLTSIEYPYGHKVTYQYRLHETTSTPSDRVGGIQVARWSGTDWTVLASISKIEWEPYGDVRGYQINAPSSAQPVSVDYSLSSTTETPPASCAVGAGGWPGSRDLSGRVRSLFVSPGPLALNQGSGSIYKRFYTWKADQVARTDTCLLGATTPVTEQFTYDGLLRLASATRPTGNFAATGGAFNSRVYTYDGRGNRLTEEVDGQLLTLAHGTGSFADRLDSRSGIGVNSALNLQFSYDADGRASEKRWATVGGTPMHKVEFNLGPSINGGNETVFRSVKVNGGTYEYYYDAMNRRRLKRYPSTAEDEFFYDTSHLLLVDRGNPSATPPSGGYGHHVDDTYVWLGNRPVMVVRGRLTAQMERDSNPTGDCGRNGEPATCGVYFPVMDMLGKPVLMLDQAGKVTGAADYEPFGHVNRVSQPAATLHPYPENANLTLATFEQPSSSSTVRTRFRALFGQVDTVDTDDFVSLVDADTSATLGPTISQPASGRFWSHWVQPTASRAQVRFTSDALPTACSTCAPGTCSPECTPANGVTLEGYEYQRFQSGAQSFWIPLRFPGQYHDSETDLFENWNRYYDPTIGQYLQPEPLLNSARTIKKAASNGSPLPTYGYAQNNPIQFIDPDGLKARCPNGFWIGAPLALGEIAIGPTGGLGFGGIYSCTSAPISVAIISVCSFGSAPPSPFKAANWKKLHAGCGIGAGWTTDTYTVADFEGWSFGGFASVGAGIGVTGFVEGHDPRKPDTFGAVVGPGAGAAVGPLACKTWAWEL